MLTDNTRTMARHNDYGGFDEDFVGEIKDTLICHICSKPLRDPHLTVCCGHNFCESCLAEWSEKHRGEQCCPFCRSTGEEFQHVPDKRTKREINALSVRCSRRRKGCEWVGELGALKGHLDARDGCGYVEVVCPNGCNGEKVMRKDLQRHLDMVCENRPYHCEYCSEKGTYVQIVNLHYRRCPEYPLQCPNKCSTKRIKRKGIRKHRKDCPLEKVSCPFAVEGCEARRLPRKDLTTHIETTFLCHQLLMLKSLQERAKKDEERDKREEKWDQKLEVIAGILDSLLATCTEEQKLPLQSIRSVIDDSYCLKVNGAALSLQMTNFSEYKKNRGVWYSAPFYLGDTIGLKLRLVVYPNGIAEGADTHISLVIECLPKDVKESLPDVECGSYVKVTTSSKTEKYSCECNSKDFCVCSDQHAAVGTGLLQEYRFIEYRIAEKICHDDTLEFTVEWCQGGPCCCICHMSIDEESVTTSDDDGI